LDVVPAMGGGVDNKCCEGGDRGRDGGRRVRGWSVVALGTSDGRGPVVVRAVSVARAGVGVLAACHRSSPGRCGRWCVGAGCFLGVGLVQPSLGGRREEAPDTPWWTRLPCTVARVRESLSLAGPASHLDVGG